MADEVPVHAAMHGVAPGSRILAAPCCGTPETLLGSRAVVETARFTSRWRPRTGYTIHWYSEISRNLCR